MFRSIAPLVMSLFVGVTVAGCATAPKAGRLADDPLIRRAAKLATASISDAMDQVLGQRGFLSSELRPVGRYARMCGRAVTVLSRPSTDDPQPPREALRMIDEAAPGSVLVIVNEGPGGADVAAFGGIMCTGSVVRGLAGALLDGGCRDIAEIDAAGFPVFARSIVPSSSVGRYINVSASEPVTCGGVVIRPGDIIASDRDGVVAIPADRAEEVIAHAEQLEAAEAETTKAVRELKSIRKALDRTGRI